MERQTDTGMILGMSSASERCYYVLPSLIGWAHFQNDSWDRQRSPQQPLVQTDGRTDRVMAAANTTIPLSPQGHG